jgi:predicted dehydrogenase
MSTAPVGIALVGAGAFGRFCLEAFAQMPEVRIAAVVDIERERAESLAAKYQAQSYDSLDTALEQPDIQIVALNTPPYLHGVQGLNVLRAGKHLFCEKPLATTLADATSLIQEAEKQGRYLTVDYIMRHNPYVEAAANLARDGILGNLRHMDLINHAAGLDLPADHWFWDKSKSGGIWIEHGVHFFDMFAWIARTPGTVIASQGYQREDGYNDRVEALARYGDAAAHFYHAFDKSGATEQTTVLLTFERGYVTLREWLPTSIEILSDLSLSNLKPYLPGAMQEIPLTGQRQNLRAYDPAGKQSLYRRCIQSALRDLVQAVTDPGHTLRVTGSDGRDSLSMAIAAEHMMQLPK